MVPCLASCNIYNIIPAVLCAGAPHQAPFLADESAAAVSGLGKVDYTMAYYLDYAKRVCEKAKELDNEGLCVVCATFHLNV